MKDEGELLDYVPEGLRKSLRYVDALREEVFVLSGSIGSSQQEKTAFNMSNAVRILRQRS